MAVTTQESTEYANVFTTQPAVMNAADVWGGRLRVARFTHDQSGAGDVLSSVALCKLPPGKVTILGALSRLYVNWTTAVATIDIGWDAYTDKFGAAVALDVDGLDDGVSVETAGPIALCTVAALAAVAGVKSFESSDGVTIRATTASTAIIAGDDITGYIVYISE